MQNTANFSYYKIKLFNLFDKTLFEQIMFNISILYAEIMILWNGSVNITVKQFLLF